MYIEELGNDQYDDLASCPFCAGIGLAVEGHNCRHFVVAFQDGDWSPDLCPPVLCDGFRFQRNLLEKALAESSGIVCKLKALSGRHPRIVAYFCAYSETAAELREKFRRMVIRGSQCPMCGSDTAVVLDDGAEIVCAHCGNQTEPIPYEF